jgi:imidazolonepropionase-like amidohydrolase/ectoine hydroxylase-related dioxygenase (phytanoyl-CoA dioxygenase family)
MPPEGDLEAKLRHAIVTSTRAAWRLVRVWSERQSLNLLVEVGIPSESPFPIVLEIRAARPGERAYAVVGGLAFSYRLEGSSFPHAQRPSLDTIIASLASVLAESAFDPSVDELPAKADVATFPTPYQRWHLDNELTLAPETIAAYRKDGHVVVQRALKRDVLLAARPHVLAALTRFWPTDLPPVAERRDAYSRSFTQITDVGARDPQVRVFSQAHRVARMAADLMGVRGVRCFCEDWLVKEPGAGITPWHQDEAVFPFDAEATITCWIPLQDVGARDGLARFARGSHRLGLLPIEDINDESEEAFAKIIAEHGLAVDELPPMLMGDISFHNGRTVHGAFPNAGEEARVVLALHCFADRARLKSPTTSKMAQLFAGAAPGRTPGDPAVAPCWPLLYEAGSKASQRKGSARSSGRTFHLSATIVARGGAPVDIWIEDGRLRFEPVDHAEELAPPGGFVTSGLVDCHSHISYPHDRSDPVGTPRWMNERRAEYAMTGVLSLRDMGAVDDAISSLTDIPGLPRVQAAGNMILRHEEFPFTPTEPRNLVRACAERIESGARWTKIFADWSHDYRGRINSGFAERDDVTYPPDLLAEAVAKVHELGGRVAAHAFTRSGAEASILAGVDSLEHGWGLDEELVAEMARRNVAWVPLVGIAPNMWRIARREEEPARAEWIERVMAKLARLLPMAKEAGVAIFAGTDLFPEVTVGDEIRQLHELGLDAPAALAAASWAARDWLEEPGFIEGAPADLVLYRTDPRRDLGAVFKPELILAGGARVVASFAHVRPRHSLWTERIERD